MTQERIPAAEAAARLGVKRETLYAYVSRGLIESITVDGKTSTFDANEVERLQRRRRGKHRETVTVPLVSTITHIENHAISYRGQPLADLVRDHVRFEAVADLLWTGEFDPEHGGTGWVAPRELVDRAHALQAVFPEDSPIVDRLRATVALASACDPLRGDRSPRSFVRAGRTLVSLLVDAIPVAALPVTVLASSASAELHRIDERSPQPTLADRLWPKLTASAPTTKWRRALNCALVVLADHDLAPSTFAARIAASARADVYSVVGTGLGPIGGALHGAASRPLQTAFIDSWDSSPAHAAAALLASGSPVPGFGHFLYPEGDPRYAQLMSFVRDAAGNTRHARLVHDTTAILADRTEQRPNIDCAVAALSALAAMGSGGGETIFAIARTAGWIAHGLAEFDEAPLRFRPVSRWVG